MGIDGESQGSMESPGVQWQRSKAVGLRLGCCRGYGMQRQGGELGQKEGKSGVVEGTQGHGEKGGLRKGRQLTQKVILGSQGGGRLMG